MISPGILDIINAIAVFQLVFFSLYLQVKGNRIPSTVFLQIHLLFQLLTYISYLFWSRDFEFVRYMLLISLPSLFLLSPTFYFYVRSRLYRNFLPHRKLLLHAIPAFLMMILTFRLIITAENFHDEIIRLSHNSYYFIKIQFIIYNVFTLYIIYRYRNQIKNLTSSSENRKLNWLFLITYGIMFTSLTDFIMFLIPSFTDRGWGYPIFFVFINIFFFKAIIQPDQFLGIDESKLRPVNVSEEKNKSFFEKIEDIIDNKKLYLDPDLTLHNVSQATGISDRVVSQVIRQNTSLNFCDYINLKRLAYAKEILINTTKAEKNVLEILYEAGFNSKSVFNTQFKKHTGMSPTEYREKFYKNSVR